MKKLIKKRLHDRVMVHGYNHEKWTCTPIDVCTVENWTRRDCELGGSITCQGSECFDCGF
jgi:hypothetical protein